MTRSVSWRSSTIFDRSGPRVTHDFVHEHHATNQSFMFGYLRFEPILNLPWSEFVLGFFSRNHIGTRPFFAVKLDAHGRSIGNAIVLQEFAF